MSCGDTLHTNFRQLSQWIGMMWGLDRPLWTSALSIWFGAARICSGETVFFFFLYSPSGRADRISWNAGCRFTVAHVLTFLRKPWNPLSCNSFTIHLGGGGGSAAATRRLQESFIYSFFIGTCGHQHWAGQSWSRIWGTKVSFHTWTATGREKKKKKKI